MIHKWDAFEHTIQKDIQTQLLYYEIYEYGELTERHILSCGDFGEEHSETLKLHMETRTGEWVLTSEINGMETEMRIYNPQYTAGSRGGGILLGKNQTGALRCLCTERVSFNGTHSLIAD